MSYKIWIDPSEASVVDHENATLQHLHPSQPPGGGMKGFKEFCRPKGTVIFPQILKMNNSMSFFFSALLPTQDTLTGMKKCYENGWSYVTPELRNPDQRWEAVKNCHQDLGVMVEASARRKSHWSGGQYIPRCNA